MEYGPESPFFFWTKTKVFSYQCTHMQNYVDEHTSPRFLPPQDQGVTLTYSHRPKWKIFWFILSQNRINSIKFIEKNISIYTQVNKL